MRKIVMIVSALLLIITITACNKSSEAESDLYSDKMSGENEILLYHIAKQQMGTYNKATFQWKPQYDKENVFQYVFGNMSKWVVSGHSIENDFVLLTVSEDQKKIDKVLGMQNNQDAFFPLTDDGSNYYYVLYEDEKNTNEIKRSIFKFDDKNNIEILLSTNEMITSGVIIESTLYYTAYNQKNDRYTAYSFPLNEKGTDVKARVVKRGLTTSELYNVKGELYFSSENKIFNDKRTFNKKDENFFVDHVLVQFNQDANQALVCVVVNTDTNEELGRYQRPVNFEKIDNTIVIYCEDGLFTLDIGGQRR